MNHMDMKQLPSIEVHQSWCCARGCGECRAVQIDFEYSRTEDMDGNLLESKTDRVWASHCCHSELMLWDDKKQNFIDVPSSL